MWVLEYSRINRVHKVGSRLVYRCMAAEETLIYRLTGQARRSRRSAKRIPSCQCRRDHKPTSSSHISGTTTLQFPVSPRWAVYRFDKEEGAPPRTKSLATPLHQVYLHCKPSATAEVTLRIVSMPVQLQEWPQIYVHRTQITNTDTLHYLKCRAQVWKYKRSKSRPSKKSD